MCRFTADLWPPDGSFGKSCEEESRRFPCQVRTQHLRNLALLLEQGVQRKCATTTRRETAQLPTP